MSELKQGHLQGTTLYSYTRMFHQREMTMEELIREVARRGQGPGLEVIGFQSIRNFPNPGDEFIGKFKDLIAELGLIPTSLAVNADLGLRRDRLLTHDEMIDYMAAQINLASKLGFPLARVQISMTPDVMEALLPVAQKANVKLGLEVHSHHSPRHQEMVAHIERYEKLNSGYLGFVPDFGATTVGMPPSLIKKYRETGVPEEMITELLDLWQVHHAEGAPKDGRTQGMRMGQVAGIAAKYGFGETAIDYAINHCGLFGHADPSEWADIMHLVWHTHGKFFGMDENGDEPTTPLVDILKVYADHGYTGSISSEYEGFHWDKFSNPFDQVAGHQKRIREIMQGYGYEVRTKA
jgi:sugar phosphate isomerase/epimerase